MTIILSSIRCPVGIRTFPPGHIPPDIFPRARTFRPPVQFSLFFYTAQNCDTSEGLASIPQKTFFPSTTTIRQAIT